MEIVYLWIEKYKNIENNGFNFNPKFTCYYDQNINEITINENKNYINMFPKNINVTAIIGDNGCGKSSLIELVLLSFFSGRCNNEELNWILVYDEEEDKFLISPFTNENIAFNKIIIDNSRLENSSIEIRGKEYYFNWIDRKDFFNLHYNPSMELPSSFFLNYISDSSRPYYGSIYDIDYKPLDTLNILSFPSKKKGKIDIGSVENTSILNMFKTKRFIDDEKLNTILGNTFHNNTIKFVPIRVNLELDTKVLENNLKQEKLREIVFKNQTNLTLKNLYIYFVMLILSTAHEPFKSDDTFKEYFFDNEELKNYFINKYKSINMDKGLAYQGYASVKLAQNIYDNIDEFIDLSKKLILSEALLESSEKLDVDVHETARLIDILNQNHDINLQSTIKNLIHIEKVLPVLPSYIKINVYDKNGKSFSDFSSGEKNLINFIYSLMYYIYFYRQEKKVFNILLDEVEIGLNPKWQKSLLLTVVNLLKQYNNKFLITIASHSPFILSDLPNSNVIFLEKGQQVYPDIETFGANIHTLLSHGFFMNNGLIGDFAKQKINELIDYLSNDYKEVIADNKEAQNFIRVIGEPILRKQFQKMLDSKRLEKIDRIDTIEQQIKRLSEELEKLKNG